MSPRRWSVAAHALLAALAYVPLLLTAPGHVAADTKQYLYLDPARLLSRAWSMWDPNVGAGTVTHQNIGYLFPMGPWYWFWERVGVPDWVAQRLWLGTVLFLAGAGVLFLLRTLGRHGPSAVVAAAAYQLSPYSLDYAGRISVILLPFAGLGWMIGLVARALRSGGWRHPALFALVVLTVGGVNATALLYAGLAPVLWVVFATFVLGEVPWRASLAATARIGLLTAGTSAWWMSGLWAQSRYGLPILSFTETVDTVAKTSLASETLRGLGYWFFYGRDKLGPWIDAAVVYMRTPWLLALSFVLPVLALASAAIARWRERAYFVALVAVGTVVAVGTYPFDRPSPLGGLFKDAATGSTAGLALRSTARAVPLVALGLAVLLGGGVAALLERRRRAGVVAAGALVAVAAVNLWPLWQGTIVDRNLRRPEEIPSYWLDAARHLDGRGEGTRILELPGADFAAYRWGNAVDPITPGLLDRPYVARELIPHGQAASADLLIALDRRLQEGVLEPGAIAPVARLLGVGDVVYRADLQFERYNTPRPRPTWRLLTGDGTGEPPGLAPAVGFGTPAPSVPVRFPLLDELALATPPSTPDPPPVAVFGVRDPVPIVRAAAAGAPVVVAGDGEGLVDLAASGLLDGDVVGRRPLRYAASFADDELALRTLLAEPGATLVLTDTNRRRAQRWSTVREVTGYTETAGEEPLRDDPKDARLEVFGDAGDEWSTVVEQRGVGSVQASDYGNRVSYTPEDRAANALDGDARTAWRTSAFGNPVGERLVVRTTAPVTTDHVTLLQPVHGPRNRFVTRAALRLDGGQPFEVDLGPGSREAPGQRIALGATRTFRTLEIRIVADNVGEQASYLGYSSVGFAEVVVGDARVDEVVRLPAPPALREARDVRDVAVVLSRLRTRPSPLRSDEEPALARAFTLPVGGAFTLTGAARLDTTIPDEAIDDLLGARLPGRPVHRSSARLPGDVASRAAAAFDGRDDTAWQSPFGAPSGQWVEVDLPAPGTVDRLDLRVVADGRHSVPTRVTVSSEAGARTVDLPAVTDGPPGRAAPAPVSFPPLTGRRFRVTVDAVREVRTFDYYGEADIAMPVAIAEVGIDGATVARPAAGAPVPAGCRTDLLTVDGRALGVRVSGTVAAAERGEGLDVRTCDGAPLDVAAGEHEIRTAEGRDVGISIDRLVLRTPRPAAATVAPPAIRVRETGRVSMDVDVSGVEPSAPFWLVLGQSRNDGWRARITGDGGRDLGAPALVDGYANGWLVQPPAGLSAFTVHVEWAPQRVVNIALALSALAALVCVALAIRRPPPAPADERAPSATWSPNVRVHPVVVVVVATLGAALVAGTGVAVATGVLTAASFAHPRLRRLAGVAAAGSLAIAGAYTLVQQLRYDYPAAFEWPTFFARAHAFGWAAVTLLVADALVSWSYRRGSRREP